ncbi:MAG: hypothetical protein RSC82_06970, partial [Oscillospiraceae bacterium]
PRNLMEATGRRQTYSRAMVCIEVLAERGLIIAKKEGDRLQLSLTEFAGKADLEASGVMVKLRKQAGGTASSVTARRAVPPRVKEEVI